MVSRTAAAAAGVAALISGAAASSLEHRQVKQSNSFIRQRRHHAMRRENTTLAARREDAVQDVDERGLLGDTLNGVGQLVGGILGVPPKTTQAGQQPAPQPTQQPSNPNPSPNPNPAPAPAPSPVPSNGNGGGQNNGGTGNSGGNSGNDPVQSAPVENPSSGNGNAGGNSNTGGNAAVGNNGNGNNNNGGAVSGANATPVQAFIAGQTSVASPDDARAAIAAATLGGQAGALQSVTVTQGSRVFTAAVANPTSSSDLVGASSVDTEGNPTTDGQTGAKKSSGSNVAIPIAVVVVLVVVAAIAAFVIRKRRANHRDRPSEYAGYGRARRANGANKTLSGDSWLAGRQTAYYTDADPAATFHASQDADLSMPPMHEQQQPEMSERPLSSFGEADMTGTGGYRPESGSTIRMPASQSQASRLYQLNNSTPGSRRTFFDTYQSEQEDAMWSADSHSNSRHSDGLFYDGSATAGYSNAAARGMDEAGAEHAGVPSPYRDIQRGNSTFGGHETASNRSSASILPYDNKLNYRHPEAQRTSTAVDRSARYSAVSEQSAAPSVFSASADHGEALMMSDDPFNVVAKNQRSSMDFDDAATVLQKQAVLPPQPLSPKDFARNPDASRWSG